MTKRLEYIDAFRGLCIFAVVFLHIVLFCGLSGTHSAVEHFFRDFFLVGFFFISGFLAYKDNLLPNAAELGKYIWKKIRTLLIPSIAVMAAYCGIVKGDIAVLWSPWNLWVTWFTYVLFSVSIIYGVLSYLFGKFGRNVNSIMLLISALLFYGLAHMKLDIGEGICLGKFFYYYPFFALGVLCKVRKSWFDRVITNKYAFLSIVLIYLLYHIVGNFPLFVSSVCSILLVYGLVERLYKNEIEVPCNKYVLSVLSTLGKYSLEIYFIHFILLFHLPESIANYLILLEKDSCWWGNSSYCFAEFIILCPLSLIISYTSIFLSHVIKQIPFFDKIFFGR